MELDEVKLTGDEQLNKPLRNNFAHNQKEFWDIKGQKRFKKEHANSHIHSEMTFETKTVDIHCIVIN